MYRWANTLKSAGVDLVAYGKQEYSIWQSFITSESYEYFYDKHFAPVRLLFGNEPADWSLELMKGKKISLYELHTPPGSWCSVTDLPKEIPWKPSRREETEGHWIPTRSIWVWSKEFDLRYRRKNPRNEPFDELMQSYQDDHGIVALRARPRTCETGVQRRSASQPPPIRRRAKAYLECQEAKYNSWQVYHLCPLDNRWRLTCGSGDRPWNVSISLRECLKGQFASEVSLHDTTRWKTYNVINGWEWR